MPLWAAMDIHGSMLQEPKQRSSKRCLSWRRVQYMSTSNELFCDHFRNLDRFVKPFCGSVWIGEGDFPLLPDRSPGFWNQEVLRLRSWHLQQLKAAAAARALLSSSAAATMEHIQRSIHDVLDIHRKQVPHLYRLSDAELMRVIRYGHNPAEPAIRACLPGVFALDVGPSVMSEGHAIRGLVGDTGEYLSLPEELADWLPKLISQMSHLLRWSMFGLMLSNFNASDPRVLDEKYPLQVRAAALDLAFTTEVEGLLVEITSASLLQARRLSLCTLIDQIQEKRLQANLYLSMAADSEDRGVDFESFVAGSSSEEESVEEEETETEEEEDENEDEEEEEEEEEEEPTSDESVESEESDEQPAGGRMAARKACAMSAAETGGRKKEPGARKLLPEHVQAQVPWQLLRISMASALQQLLRWREAAEEFSRDFLSLCRVPESGSVPGFHRAPQSF
eukprot:s163_g2.t1